HGANKQNTVYQAGKNVQKGYSQSDAKKFCETISDQDLQENNLLFSKRITQMQTSVLPPMLK
ncbi:hypothetical protein KQI13_13375, partial [Anaerostipes hadrus]|nr:hypothetical protein [Anaerostipes hadrus]